MRPEGRELSDPGRVLFVAGVSRSGSTVLDFILGNRPDGVSLGEIYAWYRPFRAHHRDPECACGRNWRHCPVWQQVGRPKARHLHRTVRDRLGAVTVVDSSKNLTWIHDAFRWAAADGIEPIVVLSWRPPQALAYSYWKRTAEVGGRGSKPPWMTNLEGYVRRLDDLRVGYHVVDFDQLITDPVETLDRLHSAIGMETWPGQERFWEGEYHSLFGSGGAREQLRSPSAALTRPALPSTFLQYWEALPVQWRRSLEELNEVILAGAGGPRSSRRLPPAWYFKGRGLPGWQRLRRPGRRPTPRT